MLINLTEYFEVKHKQSDISVPIELNEIESDGIKYPVLSKDELKFHFGLTGDGKLVIDGSTNFSLEGSCDRCLKSVKIEVPIEFTYTVVKPDGYHELDEDDEQGFMDGYELDTEILIYNELLMSLPMKVLCKETCKGLCPVCGKNRNDGDCGCDTFVPDPRMAAIKDIFNANKEV